MGVIQLMQRAVGWILKTALRNFPVLDAQRLEKLFTILGMNPVPATLVHILIQNQESNKDKISIGHHGQWMLRRRE